MGIVSIKDITYANLITLINNNDLVVNQKYKITDYATVHYRMEGYEPVISDIYTGINEPIIVTAIGTNTIDNIVKSEMYPNDIIHYDWNPNNWIRDKGFADNTNMLSPVIIEGWKGVIYFRHDTINNNSAGNDFRNCKDRRYRENCPIYLAGTTYALNAIVKEGNKIYTSIQAANTAHTPSTSGTWWKEIINLEVTRYIFSSPNGLCGIPADPLDYIDCTMFMPYAGKTYEASFFNNTFKPMKDDALNWYNMRTILCCNVLYGENEDAYAGAISNNFEIYSTTLTILGNISYNYFGMYVDGLIIGRQFNNNNINSINLWNIIIGENTSKNSFGHKLNMYNCIFPKSLINNNFEDGNFESINFGSATYIFQGYSKRIFKNSSGVARLEYVNGSNVTVNVAPTT